MKLFLENFRKHEKLSLNFSSLTLLKGSSGQGKSTTFAAIYWCLFGTLKCVYPFSSPNAKTLVKITLPEMEIIRTRNPKTLSLSLQGATYKDKEAQGLLEQIFGNKNLWLATSYLEQGQNHALIRGSNANCMELLDSLAFSGENPREFISRIDLEYKKKEGQVLSQRKILESLQEKLSPLLPNFCEEDMREKEVLSRLEEDVKEKKKLLPLLIQKVMNEKQVLGKFNTLEEERKRVRESLSLLPEEVAPCIDLEEEKKQVANLRLERDRALYYQKIKATHDTLMSEIAQVRGEHMCDLSLDVSRLERDRQLFEKNQALVCKLGLPYQKEQVQKEISNLQERINQVQRQTVEYQVHLKQEKARKDLLAQLSALSLPDLVPSNICDLEKECELLRDKLSEVERRSKLLTCPHCQKKISYANGKLLAEAVVGEGESKVEVENALKEKKKELELSRKYKELVWKKENLEKQLSSLALSSEEPSVPPPVTDLQNRMALLLKVEFYPPPLHSEEDLQRIRKLQTLHSKLPSLVKEERKVTEIEEELNSLLDRVKIAEEAKLLYEKQKRERQSLEEREKKLSSELSKMEITDSEGQLNQLKADLERLEKEIASALLSNQIYSDYQEYKNLEGEHEACYADLLALQKLKALSLQAEMHHLETVVRTCNYVLEKVCNLIFEEPIKACLCLTKQLKNGSNVHKVNFSLNYRGMEGEVEQLSGGEKQRLSIALTLALSQFSSGPLLFDECLAYLDSDLQELCLEAIREFASDKQVIYIGHNMTEGYFDDTISLC
ncbi:DNA double-strand break repair ATPase [Brazilian cedratvirus IHUMI]|uniref:DNA double-strand break repair ATPase n=1 Tax=Brazilian cedratvirus IHUMI TaxID=2126980 RepID=A0A2R8FFI2_9VIRU|nr:DNA double-strand break repair ATPase [Brazilian cedratvirus IHUMI]